VIFGLGVSMVWGLTGFAWAVLVGNSLAVMLGLAGVCSDGDLWVDRSGLGPRAVWADLKDYRDGLVASWAGSTNSYLPIVVVAGWATSGLAAFALTDRMLRYALATFSPVVQHLQGWLPESADRDREARRLVKGAMIIGLIACALVALLGGSLAELLSGGGVDPGAGLLVPFAVITGTLVVGQVTALVVLVPLALTRTLAVSTVAGTVMFLLLAWPMGTAGGASGVAWAMAGCELLAVSWQVATVLARTRVSVGTAP
jgi:O-antigen/teichoic acid export membrane protein